MLRALHDAGEKNAQNEITKRERSVYIWTRVSKNSHRVGDCQSRWVVVVVGVAQDGATSNEEDVSESGAVLCVRELRGAECCA